MPPFGLWPIPQHHLHGSGPTMRPVFNSLNFGDERSEKLVPGTDLGPLQVSGEPDHAVTAVDEKKGKKKKRKGKGDIIQDAREPSSTGGSQPADLEIQTVTPAVVSINSQGKSNKKEKTAGESGTHGEPSIIRKRKRDATRRNETPPNFLQDPAKGSFVVGEDMLQTLQVSMGDFSSNFGHIHTPNAFQSSETQTKKEQTSSHGHGEHPIRIAADEDTPTTKKSKKMDNKAGKRNSLGVSMPETPIKAAMVSTILASSTLPKETPVPLPSNVSPLVDDRREDRGERLADPRKTPSKTPNHPTKALKPVSSLVTPQELQMAERKKSKEAKKSRKERISFHLSPPTPDAKSLVSSSPAAKETHKFDDVPDIQAPLTASNLVRCTLPLDNASEPGRYTRNLSSAGATTTSSVSSLDEREDLIHTGKPYSRSGAEVDPFVVPVMKKNKRRELHEESDVTVFEAKYRKAQKTTNFSDESEYLDKHLAWQIENNSKGPLQCLGLATGCNSKREQVLRLSKEDPSNLLKVFISTDGGHNALEEAKLGCTTAESFLMMSVAAKVPVPIGHVEGLWTLYCPSYSQIHVDKYGFGQRTLSIFSIPGIEDDHSYTARLSIPPRSMLYSVVSFAVPPHASFRTTTIKTSAEGYKMDLIFLGNGYLQLRVDLNLLLRGKPTETAEGKPMYMEFIGVHKDAVQWKEKEDELEVEGKKMFAKYDGGSE